MITSLQNPLVKQLRKLHRAKERRIQGVYLLEGTHLLEAACDAGRSLMTVCFTPNWQATHTALEHRLKQVAQRVEVVSPEVLAAISTTVNPDGIVATDSRMAMPLPTFSSLGIVLETVQDPGNLGTIIRTAAAVGAEGLLLSHDSVEPDHPKVLRASAGQWFQMPMAVSVDLLKDVLTYQQAGMQIVATLPTANQTYWEIDFCQPTLILLGNEGAGLTAPLAKLANHIVQIPLNAGVESLNVAIAAALMLYEAKRQRLQPR